MSPSNVLCSRMGEKRLNLSDSQYDQETYLGRVQHFVKLTNPLNLTLSGFDSPTIRPQYNVITLPFYESFYKMKN